MIYVCKTILNAEQKIHELSRILSRKGALTPIPFVGIEWKPWF